LKLLQVLAISVLLSTPLFSQIKFDAEFESGNIKSAKTTDSVNFIVETNEDIGGRWFYFRITGVKDKYIKVTISNSDANRPVYSYNNKDFERFTETESPQYNVFKKTFSEDTVYVAYYNPYTYSYLQERINDWQKSEFVKVDTLGYSPMLLPIQEIILTDENEPNENKIRVWVHARTHPGETPSSFHFDGIVNTLLGDDEVISFYRKKFIFHLIPFVNPDGVFYGKSRTNFSGIDLEREWNKADSFTAKEALILKNRLKEINNEKIVSVFLNLHSQAASYCTFWIHTPQSTSNYFYRREYQFANLNTSDNKYFSQPDYRESNLQSYFPEGWLWNNYSHNVMALTYETPYDKYSNGIWVDNENLCELGNRTVYAIAEFLNVSHPKHLIIDNESAVAKGNIISDSSGLNFYGNNFYKVSPGFGDNSVSYNSGNLKKGAYDIYGWWTNLSGAASDAMYKINTDSEHLFISKNHKIESGQWNFLSQINLNSAGNISIEISDSATGTVSADAFRIVYKGETTGIKDFIIPESFVLYQNYPNPFNPSTSIRFDLIENSNVVLRIYNPLGELIKILVDEKLESGQHEILFNATGLSSGVYYYQLIAGKSAQTRSMVILK